MRLSICIPTYNRAQHLANCLQSISVSRAASHCEIEVCVSDNCSTDDTESVVLAMQPRMPIKYQRNPSNLGIPRNFLSVVAMASGDFVWLLGDDDLLVPQAVEQVCALIDDHPHVEFFYVNSFHLTAQYVLSFPQPFDTSHLPDVMQPFSSWPTSGELPFLSLINPKRSFDFLGGMFLAVFNREKWLTHTAALSPAALTDGRTFSSFDNTFPHVKIFSQAFARSTAFFCATPLSVCLTGAREWAPMYPLVRSVRLVEALQEYRKNDLSWLQYVRCRNYALRTFLPDMLYMVLHKGKSGYVYTKPAALIRGNCLYPNFYFSVPYYVLGKMKSIARRVYRSLRSHKLQTAVS